MGRTEEALIDYSKAIEINPQNINVYNNRGKLILIIFRQFIIKSGKKWWSLNGYF